MTEMTYWTIGRGGVEQVGNSSPKATQNRNTLQVSTAFACSSLAALTIRLYECILLTLSIKC